MSPRNLLAPQRPDSLVTVRQLLDRARGEGIQFHRSPTDWRDEVLYFLLPDRFSDGREDSRPLLTRQEIRDLRTAPGRPGWSWRDWAESGKRWQGGTINGVRGRLDYLRGLGVTALWIGPVFKQRARLDTYHGYGIQDFLEVDPRFGARKDLLDLVDAAHDSGMRIILDIILNHSGDNWGYLPPGQPPSAARNEPPYRPWPDFYGNPGNAETTGWAVAWRDVRQQGFTTDSRDIQANHEGVWPRELQQTDVYTRAGAGNLGAGELLDPHAEHKRTDFFALKDFALDRTGVLSFLAECFKYWIMLSDCDGFRIDTVKHISLEEARNFCGSIREFAETLGKRNFLLAGEIAGGEAVQDVYLDQLAVMQRNLTAALDIGEARLRLQNLGKGLEPPSGYLESFKDGTQDFGSHRTFGDRHVSILDDHDHVFGKKLRFSTEIPDDSPVKDHQVACATAFQLFTLGIPCIYYGTEQAFAGAPASQVQYLLEHGWNDPGNYGDRYLREAMFGPEHPRADFNQDLATQVSETDPARPGFGPFGTAGKHGFDPDSPAYLRIAAMNRVRARHLILRVGRQYPRQLRLPGTGFVFPPAGELVAWSRILDNQEALILVNPNGLAPRGGDVVVAAELAQPGTEFTVILNTAEAAGESAGAHAVGSKLRVQGLSQPGDPAFLEVRDIGAAEVVVLLKAF